MYEPQSSVNQIFAAITYVTELKTTNASENWDSNSNG